MKNLQTLIGNCGGKPKRSIDKKPLNLVGTAEENQKIIGALNFLAPEGTLKMS